MSVQFSLRCRVRRTNSSPLDVSVYMKAHEYIESINAHLQVTAQTSLCSEVTFSFNM